MIKNFLRHILNFWLQKKRNFLFFVRGRVMAEKNLKTKFYLPYYDIDAIQQTIYQSRNYFEQKNLDYVCKLWHNGIISQVIQKSCVLDIGANIGNHTLYYLKECSAKYIFCFEPIKETFQILGKNIEINNVNDRVSIYNVAVGASNGNVRVESYDVTNIGGTKVALDNSGSIEMRSIDSLNISNKIGLVKIDVEGFELNVLRGMKNVLLQNKPYMTIEIRDKNFKDASLFLSSLGYKYIEISKHMDYRDYNDYLFFP